MDVARRFHDILTDYGHMVYVITAKRHIRCKCYSDKEKEADPTCPICFGLGSPAELTRHLARRRVASTTMPLPDLTKNAPYGVITPDTHFYYFSPDVQINEGDLVVEVRHDDRGRIFGVIAVFEAQFAEVLTGRRGEPIYKRVAVHAQSAIKDNIQATLFKRLTEAR